MPSPVTIFVMFSLVVTVVVIADLVRSDADDVRGFGKPLWYLVAFVPILGAIAWLMWGRPQSGPTGKRVAKDSHRRGKRHKISADRAVVVDRLTSDIRTRPPGAVGQYSADSPRSPGSLADRANRATTGAGQE